jgi:ribonucleoside-diphosphate reductase beta chain
MSGCSDFLRLIARDEVLHRNTGLKVIQILLKNPEWAKAYEVAKPEIERLFYEAVESELGWADYVLTGRELIGMNASLLKDFIHYIASHLTTPLGFKYKLKEVNTNPISWFDDYLDSAALQVAPQERENTNYVISSVSNDEEFDLEF